MPNQVGFAAILQRGGISRITLGYMNHNAAPAEDDCLWVEQMKAGQVVQSGKLKRETKSGDKNVSSTINSIGLATPFGSSVLSLINGREIFQKERVDYGDQEHRQRSSRSARKLIQSM
jgi:hypothetical protein